MVLLSTTVVEGTFLKIVREFNDAIGGCTLSISRDFKEMRQTMFAGITGFST